MIVYPATIRQNDGVARYPTTFKLGIFTSPEQAKQRIDLFFKRLELTNDDELIKEFNHCLISFRGVEVDKTHLYPFEERIIVRMTGEEVKN